MIYEVLVEKTDYEEMFAKEICECILNSCFAKCGEMIDSRIIKGLKIRAIKLRCEENQAFLK